MPKDLSILQEYVHKALRAWHETKETPETTLPGLLTVRARSKALQEAGEPLPKRLAANEILLEGLETLAEKDKIGEQILRERFLNDETIISVGYKLKIGEDQVNRGQRKALELLTELLYQDNLPLLQNLITQQESELPPPSYTELFGVGQSLKTLRQVLLSDTAPWLISITGLGGLGKTSLADAALREIIRTAAFEQVAWVRAEVHTMSGESLSPELMFEDLCVQLAAKLAPDAPRGTGTSRLLRQILKNSPHLVVFDNLESEADTLYLFHQLADLGGPSKIVITSRTHPPAQANVFSLSLSELSDEDALALIRHHAKITGLPELAEANNATLTPIIEATGGNPFALKLTVSLAHALPLAKILSDLPRGRSKFIEEMFQNIYWKAWQALSPNARQLLQAMPLVSMSGGTFDYLQVISGLEENDLSAAIHELVARSLMEARGTALDRRYGIHRLTETFLQSEVIGWPGI